eukprot:GHVT01018937.1.p1 GENE.GHVT01018937.1~~GHVT01018937.1.p1  ORF type:complete len:142 (-),score=29.79 GHVT01018937.1:240-665(-)
MKKNNKIIEKKGKEYILEERIGTDFNVHAYLLFSFSHGVLRYEGYSSSEDYIVEFWKIVFQFDNFQKKQFLKFCTGSDRPPMFGLGEVELTIQKNGADPTNHLPTAYTCFSVLLLPHYHSVHKLKALLLLAIENAEGFGLQ